MKSDYSYCIVQKECIHRRGCKRWIGNYSDQEVKELYTKNRFVNEIDFNKCVPNYKNKNCTNSFQFLDRFRLSTGEAFK